MRLKKSLGQHILIAEPTLEKIVRTLAPSKDDTVLEIGPGTGKLTRHLAKATGRVIAVEKDSRMIEEFKVKCLRFDNTELINADFLDIDFSSFLNTRTPKHQNTKILFCGNLPYNISTPILFKLRDYRHLFDRGVVTVQREVAKRLVARPGSKDYGVLSILMQVAAKIEKCFDISPRAFIPPPEVTSSVIKIIFPDPPPYEIVDEILFTRVVKTVFQKRRKMIRNSLPKDVLPFLEVAGIDPTRRPEDISIDEFLRLIKMGGTTRSEDLAPSPHTPLARAE